MPAGGIPAPGAPPIAPPPIAPPPMAGGILPGEGAEVDHRELAVEGLALEVLHGEGVHDRKLDAVAGGGLRDGRPGLALRGLELQVTVGSRVDALDELALEPPRRGSGIGAPR